MTGVRKTWIICLAWVLVGGICALLIVHFIRNQNADEYVDYYGSDVFQNAVSVAETGSEVLRMLDQSADTPCSEEDIARLRGIVFKVAFLADVGRLRDGKLICTGIWGVFEKPIAMPPRSRVIGANSTTLWKGTSGIVPVDAKVDMASLGNSIVMTEPSAFARYEDPEETLAALVLTHDGDYVYDGFGDSSGLVPMLGRMSQWYSLENPRVYSRCNDHVDVCVVATYDAPPLLYTAPLDFLLVLAGGLCAGGCVGIWHARLYRESRSWRQKLSRALHDNRLTVHYQPIIRLSDGTLCGAEALVRMIGFDGTLIPPGQFIPAAETYGFLGPITRHVIRQALTDMAPHLSADPHFYVSINVAAGDMLDPEFQTFLENETATAGVSAGQVALELTERSTASHERLTDAMEIFSRKGHRILIDDFGTGYSNFAYLARLPISGIKVDRMFTQALGQQAIGAMIVGKVCELAAGLKVDLICEGVETEKQAAHLAQMYPAICVQGFLYGRPMPPAPFSRAFPIGHHSAEGQTSLWIGGS